MPARQCAAITYILSNGAVKCSQKPNIENQQKELRTYHPAPAFKYLICGFGTSHGKGQWAGIAQYTYNNIAFYRFQK